MHNVTLEIDDNFQPFIVEPERTGIFETDIDEHGRVNLSVFTKHDLSDVVMTSAPLENTIIFPITTKPGGWLVGDGVVINTNVPE
jgi:hypothetical protein